MFDPTSLTLARIDDEMVAIAFLACGVFVAVVAIVTTAIRAVLVNAQNEKSRRDIAAYIAEGSMTAADGERLMAAGRRGSFIPPRA